VETLKAEIALFIKERNWEDFHSPKNLAIGLNVEASELLEIFLWLSESDSKTLSNDQLISLKEEIGDVMIYLLELANKFGLDPIDCAKHKIEINKLKYPSELVKGKTKKYTEYGNINNEHRRE